MNLFAFCEKINNLIIFMRQKKYMASKVVHEWRCTSDCVQSGAASSTGGGFAKAKDIAALKTIGESTLLPNGMDIRDVQGGMVNMNKHLLLKTRRGQTLASAAYGKGSEREKPLTYVGRGQDELRVEITLAGQLACPPMLLD